mgnify:CR=1 FL=1
MVAVDAVGVDPEGDPVAGAHLCHAMLLPKAESKDLLPEYLRTGKIEIDESDMRIV